MTRKPDKTDMEQLLSSYIDGSCSDEDRRRVEAALKKDAALRALHAELVRTVECIRAVGSEPMPDHVRQRILLQMERRALLDDGRATARDSSRSRPWAVLATAAVILIAAGAGWWVYTTQFAGSRRPMMLADRTAVRPQRQVAPLPRARGLEADRQAAPPPAAPSAENAASAPVSPPAPMVPDAAPAGEALAQDQGKTAGGLTPAAASDQESPKALPTQDEAYRETVAKALVARRVAVQEVAAAQEASQRAAAKVAQAQAAAQQVAAVQAAGANRPAGSGAAFATAMRPSAVPEGEIGAARGETGGVQFTRREDTDALRESTGSEPASTEPAAGKEEGAYVSFDSSEDDFLGAMQLRVSANTTDLAAVRDALQGTVAQLEGRMTLETTGPDGLTVIASVPAGKQFLLASEVAAIPGVTSLRTSLLAADTMSLAVGSALYGADVKWHIGRQDLPSLLPGAPGVPHSVPVRIVIAGDGQSHE